MRLFIRIAFALLLAAAPVAGATVSTLSLDGDWHFLADPRGTLGVGQLDSAADVRPTRVPSSWQSQFSDLRDYAGVAWYWRAISVPAPTTGQVALLRFGAVDYQAEIFVNGQKAGSHEGGYLPFEIDVTSLLHAGENQVAVRVTDPGEKSNGTEGFSYAEIPHGKQNWYIQTSGLWQSVALDLRPAVRLGSVHVTPTLDGTFAIDASVIRAGSGDSVRANAEIRNPEGKVVWQSATDVPANATHAKFADRIQAPALWSPRSPSLYELRVALSSGDSATCRFGFRSFTTREGKFYLNGEPFYLRGALDQDFYPDTVYTPPSLDYLRDEMRKAKALGLNLLRCHIKVPDPRYLEAADEVGLLIWYEIPNWDKLTTNSERRAAETLHGMVERDCNHPAIVIVSIINESWGADLKDAAGRAWLKAAYQEAKGIAPWLVVDNSACCENFHMVTDIADFHQYAAVPDHGANFARLVDDQAQRPGWLFSPYGDAAPKGDEPLVLSEFGNWGLPHLPQETPWWFNRQFGDDEITKPEGVAERFTSYQYNELFPDFNALADATQRHEFMSLKHEIAALRANSGIQGYVITEFTDVNWEANGLLDLWRHPKVFGEALARLQQDDLLILRNSKANYAPGETAQANIYVSHYGPGDLSGASIHWKVEGAGVEGDVPVSIVAAAGAAKAGSVQFTVPPSSTPVKRTLRATLTSGGKIISEDSLNLYFYPPKHPDLPPPVSFYDPAGRLRRLMNEMRARNYLEPTGHETFPILVTSTFDDKVKAKLRAGGTVVLLPSDALALAPGLEVVPRADSTFSGDWISNFLWVRKEHAPFTGIGFDTLPGFETQTATPSAVVKGIPPQNFDDVLAGMFYGWLRPNVGVLVQARAGKGKLIICTFSLATTYNSDPYATYLLDALMTYAVSNCSPHFEIPL